MHESSVINKLIKQRLFKKLNQMKLQHHQKPMKNLAIFWQIIFLSRIAMPSACITSVTPSSRPWSDVRAPIESTFWFWWPVWSSSLFLSSERWTFPTSTLEQDTSGRSKSTALTIASCPVPESSVKFLFGKNKLKTIIEYSRRI